MQQSEREYREYVLWRPSAARRHVLVRIVPQRAERHPHNSLTRTTRTTRTTRSGAEVRLRWVRGRRRGCMDYGWWVSERER